jgi:hypothetical protein
LRRIKAEKLIHKVSSPADIRKIKIDNEIFVTNADVKKILSNIYEDYKLNGKGVTISPKVLSEAISFTVENAQRRIDGKRVKGLKLKDIRHPLFSSISKKKKKLSL